MSFIKCSARRCGNARFPRSSALFHRFERAIHLVRSRFKLRSRLSRERDLAPELELVQRRRDPDERRVPGVDARVLRPAREPQDVTQPRLELRDQAHELGVDHSTSRSLAQQRTVHGVQLMVQRLHGRVRDGRDVHRPRDVGSRERPRDELREDDLARGRRVERHDVPAPDVPARVRRRLEHRRCRVVQERSHRAVLVRGEARVQRVARGRRRHGIEHGVQDELRPHVAHVDTTVADRARHLAPSAVTGRARQR
eukprot:30294-Pelagococcus_subviridis.AAC.74